MPDTRIGGVYATFRARNEEFIRASNQNVAAIRRQRQAFRELRQSARQIRGAFTGAAATIGGIVVATAGIGAATQNFLAFNRTTTQLNSLIGLSEESVAGLRQEILQLGRAGVGNVNELANGYFFLASAGLRGEEAMRALVASAQAAQIGLGSIEQVATGVTSAMGAWRDSTDSVERVTATLIATVREGRFAPEQLAREIGRAGSFAAEAGASFQDLGASFAFLSRSRDLNLASTQITALLRTFIAPSQRAVDALDAIGTSAAGIRAEIQRSGLLETMVSLRARLEANGREFREVFESSEALAAGLGLTGRNAEAAREVFESLADTTENDLARAYRAFAESDAGRIVIAMERLRTIGVELASRVLPPMVDLFNALRENMHLVRAAGVALGFVLLRRTGIFALGGALVVAARGMFTLRGATVATTAAFGALRVAALRSGVLAVAVVAGEIVYQMGQARAAIAQTGETVSGIVPVFRETFRRIRLSMEILRLQFNILFLNVRHATNRFRVSLQNAFISFANTIAQHIRSADVLIVGVLRGIPRVFSAIMEDAADAVVEGMAVIRNTFISSVNAIRRDINQSGFGEFFGINLAEIPLVDVPRFERQTGAVIRDVFERALDASEAALSRNYFDLIDPDAAQASIERQIRRAQIGIEGLREALSRPNESLDALRDSVGGTADAVRQDLASALAALDAGFEAVDARAAATAEAAKSAVEQIRESIRGAGQELQDNLAGAFERTVDGVTGFVTAMITGFESAGDAARALARTIITDLLSAFIRSGIYRLLGGFFGIAIPGFQSGGLADRGLALVGERGPELVDFRSPGRVYSNDELSAAVAGGGGGNQFVFAPVIQSADSAAVSRAVAEAFPLFESRILSRVQLDARRPSALRDSIRRY